MKILKIIFFLTTILLYFCVNGMWQDRTSISNRYLLGEEFGENEEPTFYQNEMMAEGASSSYQGEIAGEKQVEGQAFKIKLNPEKSKKPKKSTKSNLFMNCLSSSSVKEDTYEEIYYQDVTEDIVKYYLNSQKYYIDMKIFETLPILGNYNRQYNSKLQPILTLRELENSVKLCDKGEKNALLELKKNLVLNKIMTVLFTFTKSDSKDKKESELNKFLESKEKSWKKQGNPSQYENELFGITGEEIEVDDSYFDESNLLNVEIGKKQGEQFVPWSFYPIAKFDEAYLDPWLVENINLCRFKRPTPVQKYTITIMNEPKNDLFAVAETGSGKTAAFLIPLIDRLLKKGKTKGKLNKPIINKEGGKITKITCIPNALIILPTRELAQQTHKQVLKLTYRTPIASALVFGGGGKEKYDSQLETFKYGCHILIATPLRLIDMLEQNYVNLNLCDIFVMDESDRILDKSFEGQISTIISVLPPKEKRTTVMFSATYDVKVDKLVTKFLKEDYIKLTIVRQIPPNLFEKLIWVERLSKTNELIQLIGGLLREPSNKIVVFSNKKHLCTQIADKLSENGYKSLPFHADILKRNENLKEFVSGEVRILVASDAFQRGLDVRDITHVINYDLPNNYQDYIHRVGRTARTGRHGIAISFINDDDNILLDIYENAREGMSSFPKELEDRVFELRQKKQRKELKTQVISEAINNMKQMGYPPQTGYYPQNVGSNQPVFYYQGPYGHN